MIEYPKRQVHLDFHTSPDIENIGGAFDEGDFAAKLKEGHVNSITVFAKCHHGVCYFPTKVDRPHPHLVGDLTGRMIDAAHKAGARAPVYITAGWSDEDAKTHPEWVARDKEGKMRTTRFNFDATPEMPKEFCCWKHMCLNDGTYAHRIYDLTREICERYDRLDGLFYDIVFIGGPCYCPECLAGMKREGYDAANDADAMRYYNDKHIVFMKTCGEILHKYHPTATIFFNSGGADPYRPHNILDHETHYELEDLPTAWGGYDKLPSRARFFASLGKPAIGMTGKFHLDWGEFGGYKTKEALLYECISMAMNGVGCSVGDQMLPWGTLDGQTYRNIGYAYGYLEKAEPTLVGERVCDVGFVFSSVAAENEGLCNMLLEAGIGFGLVRNGDFDKYAAVILPSGAKLSEGEEKALAAYIRKGGKCVSIGRAPIEHPAIAEALGIRMNEETLPDCDYLLTKAAADGVPASPFLCYRPACRVEAEGWNVLAEVIEPLFSRTYGHFCGHKNTPYAEHPVARPAILKKGNCLVLAHDLPLIYKEKGAVAHRRVFIGALSALVVPTVAVSLGSFARNALLKQKNAYYLHLTYASPVKRGAAEIIEDIPVLADVSVSLRLPEKIKAVRLPLRGNELAFDVNDGVVSFTLPRLWCHEAIELDF